MPRLTPSIPVGWLALALLLLVHPPLSAADNAGSITEPGFIVPPPGEGFVWKKLQDVEVEKGKITTGFIADKEGNDAVVILAVARGNVVAGGKDRLAHAKAAFEGWEESVREKYKDAKLDLNNLKPPPGDRLSCTGSGKGPDGQVAHFHLIAVFGKKNLYFIQVLAPSRKEAASLAETAAGVREVDDV